MSLSKLVLESDIYGKFFNILCLTAQRKFNIFTAGELMKQSDFHVSVNGKQRRLRRVFLFEKMIILSKGLYSYLNSL